MLCTTIREGQECHFMTNAGCSYNGGLCHEIVEKCDGCNRKSEYAAKWYCTACPEPDAKWKYGNCNLATHVKSTVASKAQKVNPLKASKRAAK
ncbi:MAG: hypothetical protein GY697_15960 [Desulfobacterales bacterium]|nr:hypothetical protein [Desulfobacterales bacterium]